MEVEEVPNTLLNGNVPSNLHLLRFTVARANEIKLMKDELAKLRGTKLAFQRLPKHMRRRVMSHNVKRLPRRLREIHFNQFKKSGEPPKQKRPSRKFRRRPNNILEEYARRRQNCRWLETHLWHAKRFHVIDRWGYKIPDRPCDKAFRACYRATTQHCLVQDISYVNCIELQAPFEELKRHLGDLCESVTNLSVFAVAFIKGNREGQVLFHTFLKENAAATKLAGIVNFHWKPEDEEEKTTGLRTIWFWVPAAYYDNVSESLRYKFSLNQNIAGDNPTYANHENNIYLKELRDCLNRFRLTGPLSNSILHNVLKPINISKTDSKWFHKYFKVHQEVILNQNNYWKNLESLYSPAQASPHVILSLVVNDPRYNFPRKRTKAVPPTLPIDSDFTIPQNVSKGPIWDTSLLKTIKESKQSNAAIAEMRSSLLVPGTEYNTSEVPIPVLLIHRPGNQDVNVGYGSGWDLIVPGGWGQAIWMSLILWGARAGGLRETLSVEFEAGFPHSLSPDTIAGLEEEQRISEEYKQKYFRLPLNKRTNFAKFAIVSPFKWNWLTLINEWAEFHVNSVNVIHSKKTLYDIHQELSHKNCNIKTAPNFDLYKGKLLPVKLYLLKKGVIKEFAIICLPKVSDFKKEPVESPSKDVNEELRKKLRREHKGLLQRLRQRRRRAKKKGIQIPIDMEQLKRYQEKMRELWLPGPTLGIRHSCSREVIGFVKKGDFSFTEGHAKAVGYITIDAISKLRQIQVKSQVLVRNINSRQYRMATLAVAV